MPHAYAYFRIRADELPLDEISTQLGLQPTESWNRGEVGKYVPICKDSGWCLHSPLPPSTTDLLAHIEAVLDVLRPRAEVIRALSQRYATYLVCTGKYDDTVSPGLFLSRENIALIAALGLAIDADLYFG